ncbi:hypothetical protein IIQ44_16310 [Acinetobacter oleivorans]|uniref:Uncharacterized protein n=1 Tax=Acinetobacter oleivorans TaxID=1148157 RepID=A0ABR9NK81_9GAMM|nr:hypothetical protein [Acinetobacter oleivorans]MBE2165332.1 hypothetical protein [Acinetobacter oleivorans]MBE2173459.1 hypothetical protein [Acinetobacter oleivorans]
MCNLTNHPCLGKCTDFNEDQCSTCLIKQDTPLQNVELQIEKVWPLGTNYTDSEEAPWKRDDQNNWWFWQEKFGWTRYVGPVNQAFLDSRFEVVTIQ